MTRAQRTTARGSIVLLLLGLVTALAAVTGTGDNARAADLREFDPGNIIADQVFFDEGSMSAAGIQGFLNEKGAACSGGSDGSPCIKNYRQNTSTRAATSFCPGGYAGASGETAATIIYKVAQACGVSPQVLLVTLEKEQGLIRASNPTARKYQIAMGYGCPDTAACDSQYYGLQNQLYSAASQFQRYVANPARYNFQAGTWFNILYHPNAACGRQSVYIANAATAALYNYTPYVPNQAALNAGYGTGNSCSSYGNRNFFGYFTDWFGSTQSTGSGQINIKYRALGGASSALGNPVAATQCGLAAGGCARQYAGGSIYWSPSSGAAALTGNVLTGYWSTGSIDGWLGYPIADSAAVPGGEAGAFQGGSLYWSPTTGAAAVANELLQSWWATGGISGQLGWPIASSSPVTGGKAGAFQGGSVYWSTGTGAHWLRGELLTRYWALGAVDGELGFPTSDVVAAGPGAAAAFQGGSIYSSPSTRASAVSKDLLNTWWASGGVSGPLGFPTADTTSVTGGKASDFQGGSVYWSRETGAHWLTGDILARYRALDASAGELGFPTSGVVPAGSGTAAAFQGGSIYSSPSTRASAVSKDLLSSWWASGGVSGPLGFPTADTAKVGDGKVGAFQGGSVYWSRASGAAVLSGEVLTAYGAAGGPGGVLGFPIADQGPVTGGSAAAFQGGSIYWSAGTGAHVVRGEVRTAWWARGGITGPLGFPTAAISSVTGQDGAAGQMGRFAGGTLYWSKPTGAAVLSGEVLTAYGAAGGPGGVLGFPIADQGPVTGGSAAAFQGGSIYWSAGTGAHVVRGEVRTAWWARGGITGPLGFPTAATSTVNGLSGASGQVGRFAGGALYWSKVTGSASVSGPVLAAYDAAGGPGVLGFPIAEQGPVSGGSAAAFQDGSIYWSVATGAHAVRGAALSAYWAAGSVTGALGFPTAGTAAVPGAQPAGTVTGFERGSIYAPTTGAARRVLAPVDVQYRAAGGPVSTYGWPTSDSYAVAGGTRNDFQSGQITG